MESFLCVYVMRARGVKGVIYMCLYGRASGIKGVIYMCLCDESKGWCYLRKHILQSDLAQPPLPWVI